MGRQIFMNDGLQILMGLQTSELWAANIIGFTNCYELWAPHNNVFHKLL